MMVSRMISVRPERGKPRVNGAVNIGIGCLTGKIDPAEYVGNRWLKVLPPVVAYTIAPYVSRPPRC